MRHSVTSVDPEARTGQCSVCGPVKVYANSSYKGQRRWRCATRSLADATARYHADPEADRNARFQRLYGITVEEYDRLLAEQGGVCARCKSEPQATLRLAVDHDHKTGEVRGLLCGPCNTYLGRLDANMATILSDLAYLRCAQPILARIRGER